jgi:glycerol-3-phosphate dehydrogenase
VAEVRFAVLYEGALRLEDYWARRSSRAWFDTNAGLDSLAEAAAVMADLLAWSEERTTLEINRCIDIDRDSKSNLKL